MLTPGQDVHPEALVEGDLSRTKSFHPAGYFVPWSDGGPAGRQVTFGQVQVGATATATADRDPDLACVRVWLLAFHAAQRAIQACIRAVLVRRRPMSTGLLSFKPGTGGIRSRGRSATARVGRKAVAAGHVAGGPDVTARAYGGPADGRRWMVRAADLADPHTFAGVLPPCAYEMARNPCTDSAVRDSFGRYVYLLSLFGPRVATPPPRPFPPALLRQSMVTA